MDVTMPVNEKQLIAIDLGNTTTDVLSLKGEYSAPSQYIDTSFVSQKTLFPQQSSDILEFELKRSEGSVFLWGQGLRGLKKPEGLVETRSDGNRYLEEPFRNLIEMVMGMVAYAEHLITPIDENHIITDLSVGLPTDDFDAKRYLQNSDGSLANPEHLTHQDDCYLAFLKNETHEVTVNGVTFFIDVDKVSFADQPQGTLVAQAFNEFGEYVDPDVFNEKTTILDFGGLTILTSQYERGRRYSKADQINDGAYTLAENVANRWNKSKDANPRLKLTQNHVLNMLYEHDPLDKEYIVTYNRHIKFNVTDIVLDEIDRSTELIIERLKNIKGWDTSSYFLCTGGGSYLINYELLSDFLMDYGIIPEQVNHPRTANVRGFHIIGLLSNPDMAKHYIKYKYLLEQKGEDDNE